MARILITITLSIGLVAPGGTSVLVAAGEEAPADPLDAIRQIWSSRKYAEAIAPAEALLADEKAKGKLDLQRELDILQILATSYYWGHRATEPEALAHALRLIEVAKELYGESDFRVGGAYHYLAYYYRERGRYADARDAWLESARLFELKFGPEDPRVTGKMLEAGTMMVRVGEFEKADATFKRLLEIYSAAKGPRSKPVAETLQERGNNFIRMGEYTRARECYEEALDILESLPEPDARAIAMTLGTTGFLLELMGDLDESERSLRRAIQLSTEVYGENDARVAAYMDYLSDTLFEKGDLAGARKQLDSALAMIEGYFGAVHPKTASVLHKLGKVEAAAGEEGPALAHFQQALKGFERDTGEQAVLVAAVLESIGSLERRRGKLDEARSRFERAVAMRTEAAGADHPDLALTHHLLGDVLLEQGKTGEALEHARKAVAIRIDHLRETMAYLPERTAMLLARDDTPPEALLFRGMLAAKGENRRAWAEAAWDWAIQRQGLVQEELASRNRAVLSEAAGSGEARQAWLALAEARERIGALWVAGPGEDHAAFRSALAEARKAKESREIELARRSQSFRQERELRSLDVRELRTLLPSSSALVEIVRLALAEPAAARAGQSEERDFALVLTKEDGPSIVELGRSEDVDRLTLDWLTRLQESLPEATSRFDDPALDPALLLAGAKLREKIWDPLAGRTGGARTVLLVPDGAFHLVNLASLPTGASRFLVETGPAIHLLDSARQLALPGGSGPEASRHGTGVLAMGSPDFDADSGTRVAAMGGSPVATFRGETADCGRMDEKRWRRLPESLREVNGVESILGGKEPVVALTGGDASEERFKREAPGKRILHVATHGFFINEECGDRAAEANPLLLSGLVLAGANRPAAAAGPDAAEDGILTAEELAALDLRGVDLAVLSGCDTGLGSVATGEGVFGLRRSLAIAGARTVVMSLWPAPDRQTRRWMTSFYSEWSGGSSILESVRSATLASLRDLRESGRPPHPYLWSGFVASGDWN